MSQDLRGQMKAGLKQLVRPLRGLARRLVPLDEVALRESIVFKAANILAAERVAGDYLEFGVHGGASLTRAYHTLERVYLEHQRLHAGRTAADAAEIRALWAGMRFFAFDSFEGLPPLTGVDHHTRDFKAGAWACSEAQLRANLAADGVPQERVTTVPGWFDDTCAPATIERLGLSRAAIIHVDCDLYSSARTVLSFVTPLLTDGTVLIFDDWFCFRGNPELGEQRAFAEWRQALPGWRFTEYQKEGPWRNSFIASRSVVA